MRVIGRPHGPSISHSPFSILTFPFPPMTATYRLQLQPDFGFAEVEGLLPYLRDLGVSHVYLSPITEARAGSLHGYDVIDHNEVRQDFGGRAGLDRLLGAVEAHGLKVVLDWVPNHAGVGPRNEAWQDVLAYGPYSPSARTFDVDWRPLKPELAGKVLLPFLGRPYGEALDGGEIALAFEDGRFYATYYESRYALSPASYDVVLEPALERLERTDAYWDLKEIVDAYRGLRTGERDKAEALRLRLGALAARVDVGPWLALDRETLHALLELQHWRLAYWKTAGYEINYRRFFDINGLVGLRMEDDEVFWEAHRLLGALLAHPAVDGVRIDHVDGLFDPHGYLDRLRQLGARHVWVEKILAHGETLPTAWPTEGTTGYEFMNDAVRLLVPRDGQHALDRTYRRAVPDARPYDRVVYRSKVLVMETMLSSELFRLAYELDRISEADYHTRDFTLEALREALAEVVAAVDRYRTYVPYEIDEARTVIGEAVYRAKGRNPATESTAYDFIARVVLGDVHPDLRAAQRAWVGRFQQYTAPVAAKGVEDTAFYRHLRLLALNEVGGEPDQFSVTRQQFHAHARYRALRYPRALVALSTHDHKRGADTRVRLAALAEAPGLWAEAVAALAALGERHRGAHGPAPHDAFLFYQTLAALWAPPPSDADGYRAGLPDRLAPYAEKAAREAKLHTSWINPDEAYETDLEAFVRGVSADPGLDAALGPLAAALADVGAANTFAQTVLHLTTPGVPDLYQGTETFDLSLVDPDNRRPVDYGLRQRLLDRLGPLLDAPEAGAVRDLVEGRPGEAKFFLTARLLRLRRERPALFAGDYHALDVDGPGENVWVAYTREAEGEAAVVLVSRFPTAEARDATVPLPDALPGGGPWADWLSGAVIEGGDEIQTSALPLPFAVLVRP